jgi:hypothetical protein
MAAQPKLISNVRDFAVLIENGDGTGVQALVTPVAAGSRLKNLIITSDDTADRTVQIVKTVGGVEFILGEIVIPDGSGTNGVDPAIDAFEGALIAGLQTDGITKWMEVASGNSIGVKVKVAVTAAKKVYVAGEGGDFT